MGVRERQIMGGNSGGSWGEASLKIAHQCTPSLPVARQKDKVLYISEWWGIHEEPTFHVESVLGLDCLKDKTMAACTKDVAKPAETNFADAKG